LTAFQASCNYRSRGLIPVSAPSCSALQCVKENKVAPHIHGELLKLGFAIAQSTVARYMYRGWPPSQGWRTFLTNHVDGIAAIDLFVQRR